MRKNSIKISFKGQIFHASAKTKTKGVMIGIATYLDFKTVATEVDKEGRFIILRVYLALILKIDKYICTQ